MRSALGLDEVVVGEPGWELSGRADAGNPCAMGDEIKGQKVGRRGEGLDCLERRMLRQ